MKRLSILCLASALLALAPSARAEPRYLVYDLKTQEATPATVSDPRDATYRNGTQILFVQDPDISTDYYIGAFEVTRAQATAMNWSGASGKSGAAFGAASFSPDPEKLPEGLHFPSVKEWVAYAGTPVQEKTNVFGGASLFSSYSLADWYDQAVAPNEHGVFDMYGNAAEYVVEENGAAFYGGYTGSSGFSWGKAIDENTMPEKTRRTANQISGAVLGARLVYKTPPPDTYTLTVTLDGTAVSETADLLEGAEVTVEPPKPDGRALTRREVTPEGLVGEAELDEAFTFEMPAGDVTVAYVSAPYATVTVTGGTASVEGGQSGAVVRAFAGDVVTLTAREPGDYETFAGWEGFAEGLEGDVFTVPEDIQGGEVYAFTARFKVIPRATVTVTGGTASVEGGESGAVVRAVAGAEVTLTPRAPGKYERFADWETPEGVALGEDDVFTVPGDIRDGQEYAFRARFEVIPHATIVVVGGDASAYEAVAGDTVTLTPREAPPYQAFTGWEGPEVKGNVFTVPELAADVIYTFTATYQYYPRVLVSGGTVTVTNGKQAFGNGYYEPGANLTLAPTEIEGRTFKGWAGDVEGLTGNAYVAGDYGTTFTLTATYEDAKAETPDPVTIRLGSGTPLFGIYAGFFYSAADLYASLPLTGSDRTIAYSNTLPTGSAGSTDAPKRPDAPELPATEEELKDYQEKLEQYEKELAAWASGPAQSGGADLSKLTLRRVTPSNGKAFYLGVYETTIGHVVNLEELAGREPNTKWSATSHATFCVYNLKQAGDNPQQAPNFADYLSIISEQFGVTARFPQIADVKAVGDAYRNEENPGAGYGPGGNPADSKISDGAVVSSGTPKAADGMDVDPYGFYGLWGNCYEASSNDTGFAGSVAEGQKSYTDLEVPFDRRGYLQYASFRPLIEVEEPVAIVVGATGGPVVHVAAGEALFPDGSATPAPTQAGKKFTGWTLGGKAIDTAYMVGAEDAGKVLAATWADVPSATDITVTCKDCLGPTSAVVGGTITVYPPKGYAFNEDDPIALSGDTGVVKEEKLQDGAVTLTLKTGALDEPATLTVTGHTAPLPTPSPGYRLRLR